MADYWQWQTARAPAFLGQPRAAAWWLLWGHLKDASAQGAIEAVRARFASTAAPDALGEQASDRGLERRPAEPESALRVRLATAMPDWQAAGTPEGVVAAIDATPGVTGVIYREAWEYDPDSPLWARFRLTLHTTYSAPAAFEDSGLTWDSPEAGTFDVVAPDGELGFLQREVRRWKAQHARCDELMLLLEGAHTWDEEGPVFGDDTDGELTFDEGAIALLEL